jgi:fatty-acyl-CoA synthase
MLADLELVVLPTRAFSVRPGVWFETCARFGATFTAAPSFAYVLAHRVLRRGGSLRLGRMRSMVNGGEPIGVDAVAAVEDLERASVVPPGVHRPAYGLAEAILAVTLAPADRPVVMEAVAAVAAERSGARWLPDAAFARLGGPLPNTRLEIEGRDPGDGIGDVVVHQRRHRSGDPVGRPTASVRIDTGDVGFVVDGELVICGRSKDVIIVEGENVPPEVVEHAAERVGGVRFGGAVAFGERRRGREAIVVVAEVRPDAAPGAVRRAIEAAVRDRVGRRPRVALVAPGELPKTSSGKLRRSACRRLLGDGNLLELDGT